MLLAVAAILGAVAALLSPILVYLSSSRKRDVERITAEKAREIEEIRTNMVKVTDHAARCEEKLKELEADVRRLLIQQALNLRDGKPNG